MASHPTFPPTVRTTRGRHWCGGPAVRSRRTTPVEKARASSTAVSQRALDGHEIADGDTVVERLAEALDNMIGEQGRGWLPYGF